MYRTFNSHPLGSLPDILAKRQKKECIANNDAWPEYLRLSKKVIAFIKETRDYLFETLWEFDAKAGIELEVHQYYTGLSKLHMPDCPECLIKESERTVQYFKVDRAVCAICEKTSLQSISALKRSPNGHCENDEHLYAIEASLAGIINFHDSLLQPILPFLLFSFSVSRHSDAFDIDGFRAELAYITKSKSRGDNKYLKAFIQKFFYTPYARSGDRKMQIDNKAIKNDCSKLWLFFKLLLKPIPYGVQNYTLSFLLFDYHTNIAWSTLPRSRMLDIYEALISSENQTIEFLNTDPCKDIILETANLLITAKGLFSDTVYTAYYRYKYKELMTNIWEVHAIPYVVEQDILTKRSQYELELLNSDLNEFYLYAFDNSEYYPKMINVYSSAIGQGMREAAFEYKWDESQFFDYCIGGIILCANDNLDKFITDLSKITLETKQKHSTPLRKFEVQKIIFKLLSIFGPINIGDEWKYMLAMASEDELLSQITTIETAERINYPQLVELYESLKSGAHTTNVADISVQEPDQQGS